MTPQEALKLLDQAAAAVSGNRETHIQLARAVAILQEALAPKKEESKDNG